jgi:hypothetical protein
MHQANGAATRIGEKNRAAISDVDAQANAALIRDQSIVVLETFVSTDGCIDDTNLFSVDLLRGNERQLSETVFAADFPMHAVQPGERFRFVLRHLEAGHAQRESVNDARQCAQGLKLFSRKLTVAHLPEVVVRVVVVLV